MVDSRIGSPFWALEMVCLCTPANSANSLVVIWNAESAMRSWVEVISILFTRDEKSCFEAKFLAETILTREVRLGLSQVQAIDREETRRPHTVTGEVWAGGVQQWKFVNARR